MKKTGSSFLTFPLAIAVAILASFVQQGTAQFLVDEFGELACEDIAARVELYVRELAKDPDAPGWVETFAPKGDFQYSLQIESQVLGMVESFNSRSDIKVNPNRLLFEYGGVERSGRTRLWIIPKGTEKGIDIENKPSLELATDAEPFRFRTVKRAPDKSECVFGGVNKQFIAILEANPLATGNLVIADENQKAFQEKKRELLSALSGIDPVRLRFFFVKSKNPYVEYWIVPKRAK